MTSQASPTDWQADLPAFTLHLLAASHPAQAVEAALTSRQIEFERIELALDGTHPEKVEAIYGAGNQTVSGMLVDDEPVHGSTAIFERLETYLPGELSLFPAPRADDVRAAAQWGDEVFQQAGRRLTWGSLHFKPYAAAQAVGGDPLDPAATDFAMQFIHRIWKHHGINSVLIAEALAQMPGYLDHIDDLIAREVVGQDDNLPNAADLQIGSTLSLLMTIGDLRPLIEGRPCARLAGITPPRAGLIPAGAFPERWMPAAASQVV